MRQRERLVSNGRELCCQPQFYFERDGAENGFGSGWQKLAYFARIRVLIRGLAVGHQGRLLILVRKGGICEKWLDMENYLD